MSTLDASARLSHSTPTDPVAATGGPQPTLRRIATLDVLRGIALLGILTVHTGMIGSPHYIMGYLPVETTFLDAVAIRIVRHLAEAVLYLLFSFMFGLGLAMQIQRAAERGQSIMWIHIRRMAVLFLIGLAHTIFIWDGDILKIYGAVGLIALVSPWIRPRVLLFAAGVTFALMLFFLGEAQHIPLPAQPVGSTVTQPQHVQATIELLTNGTYRELLSTRINALSGIFVGQIYLSIGVIFALLLGMYSGLVGLFGDIDARRSYFRWVFVVAFIASIVGNVLLLLSETTRDAMTYRIGFHLSGAGLCFLYISGATLLMRHAIGQTLLMPFAAVGRLSMTNYIMQSVIQVLIFYQLGWYGTQSRFTLLMLAFVIYAFQVLYSHWWVKYFQFGPLEWLWRTLTYGQLQPVFRKATS